VKADDDEKAKLANLVTRFITYVVI